MRVEMWVFLVRTIWSYPPKLLLYWFVFLLSNGKLRSSRQAGRHHFQIQTVLRSKYVQQLPGPINKEIRALPLIFLSSDVRKLACGKKIYLSKMDIFFPCWSIMFLWAENVWHPFALHIKKKCALVLFSIRSWHLLLFGVAIISFWCICEYGKFGFMSATDWQD